jgi:cold shock CspA family protein
MTTIPLNLRVGTVKYFNQNSGYGFIEERETKEMIFVNKEDLSENVYAGEQVLFDVKGHNFLSAVHVKKL